MIEWRPVKLADTLANHPKIVRAGALLGGPRGRAEALALYVSAIGFCRHFCTDGKVSDAWLRTCGVCSSGEVVAKALSARSVQLFHRVRGGYQIHDYHDWNEKASVLKQKRAAERVRVATWREGKRRSVG